MAPGQNHAFAPAIPQKYAERIFENYYRTGRGGTPEPEPGPRRPSDPNSGSRPVSAIVETPPRFGCPLPLVAQGVGSRHRQAFQTTALDSSSIPHVPDPDPALLQGDRHLPLTPGMLQHLLHRGRVLFDVAVVDLVPLGFIGRPGLGGVGSAGLAVDDYLTGHTNLLCSSVGIILFLLPENQSGRFFSSLPVQKKEHQAYTLGYKVWKPSQKSILLRSACF